MITSHRLFLQQTVRRPLVLAVYNGTIYRLGARDGHVQLGQIDGNYNNRGVIEGSSLLVTDRIGACGRTLPF